MFFNRGSSWSWSYDNWIFNYLCNPVSSTNKTDGHDIPFVHVHVTEILLKVVLNTMTLTLHTPQHSQSCKGQSVYLCFLSECYIFYTCLDLTLYKYIFFLALAHAIDLMLPARLSDMKVMRRRHKSNTDAHSAEMDHNIKRVKQLLQNKLVNYVMTSSWIKSFMSEENLKYTCMET
jgi:hypothetical protein